MHLEEVVPWGRSKGEYLGMFDLTSHDLNTKILDCAAGSASFNAETAREGFEVISCDPIYRFAAGEIEARIHETFDALIANAEANRDEFVWDAISSPEHLGEVRMRAMQRFLEDFPRGLAEGRYVADGLPDLGFGDGRFDLALCSHFLFTYTRQLSLDFHVACIEEMCRVAREARIFPLLEAYGGKSPLLEPVVDTLRERGYRAEVRRVPYEFQRGGNEMLVVW